MRMKLWAGVIGSIAAGALAVPASGSVLVGHSGWYWGNPLPQGNTINALDFAGARGYAAGVFGTLLRTDDGGITWAGITTGVVNDLSTVDAIDANTVVIGGGCSVRRSDDGGNTFHRLPFTPSELNCPSAIKAISFASSTAGFLLLDDGTLLTTGDGGSSFSRRTAIPGTSATGAGSGASAQDVFFTSATTGFAVTHQPGTGKLYRTIDGGNTWNPVATGPFEALWFADANTGYAVGDSNLLYTTIDGGATWTPEPLAGATPSTLRSISCEGTTCLIGTAEGTRLIRTVDGGATGIDVSPSSHKVFTAGFASPTRAVAAGENGTTVVSNDAGATFSPVGGGIQGPFTRLTATSPTVAFATGTHGTLAKTTDAGQSWSDVGVATSAEVIDVSFPTPTTGFALDDAGSLQMTSNGGASWKLLNTGTSAEPSAVFAIDANRVLLIGPRGIGRSADGGGSFTRVPGAVSKADLDSADAAPGAVFVFGSRALFVSTNGGKKWAAVKRPSRDNLRAVDFVSSKRGFVLDAAGRVWTTSNRGKHWTQLVGTGTLAAYDMAFNAANRGYLLIANFGTQRGGFVLKTSDGGRTWHPQLVSNTPLVGNGIATSTGATDFAMDTAGRLFATTAGGDQGLASSLKLTTKKKTVKRGSNITVSGKLNPAVGGEQVVVSARAQKHGWVHKVVQVASDGTFTTVWKLTRFTIFVAQWTGDADHEGAGSKVLQVNTK